MMNDLQSERARVFRELHQGGILVLPNAWDPGSAVLVAAAGARAVATTSAGISWSLGLPDGQAATRDQMVEAIRRIVEVSDVPVTADIEGGYGDAPADVAATVSAVIGAGAVGVNLEDSKTVGGPLYSVDEQAKRVRAARSASNEAGLEQFVINARTDLYLFGIGQPEGRSAMALARARAYAEAGADVLFVPGVDDLETVHGFVLDSPIPINVLSGPGSPSVTTLAALGVRRVSYGASIALAAYSVVRRSAEAILAGVESTDLASADPYGTVNGAFSAPSA